MRFGNAMRTMRKRKGIKQEDFARLIGLSRITVSRIEKGHVEPRISKAMKIAKELGFSIDEVMNGH